MAERMSSPVSMITGANLKKKPDAKKDNLLAETLNEAGILAPLLSTITDQVEDKEADFQRGYAKANTMRQMLMDHFPDANEEFLDYMEDTT